jgi:hypothetical protein
MPWPRHIKYQFRDAVVEGLLKEGPMSETKLSRKLKCLHCGNVAPMEVLESANTVQSFEEEDTGGPDWHRIEWEAGYIYWLLQCFSCSNVTLERQTVHTGIDPEGIEGPFDILYPSQLEQPSGLPPEVAKAYDAALAVRNTQSEKFTQFRRSRQ